MSDTADAVVVGGGTVGAWCAYFLRRAGLARVILIEKGFLGQGASSRAAGVVRMQGGTPEAVRLGQLVAPVLPGPAGRDRHRLRVHRAGLPAALLHRGGGRGGPRRGWRCSPALGVPVRWLDPGEVDAANPTLAPGQTLGGTFCAQDGFIAPPRNVAAYTVALIRSGVEVREHVAFLGLAADGRGVAVETSRGRIGAGLVVLTGGPKLAEVGQLAGLRIPAGGVRHQVAVTERHPDLDPARVPMVFDLAAGLYWRPEEGGLLFGMSNPDEPPGENREVDEEYLAKMRARLAALVPVTAGLGLRRVWAATIDYTPDHLPIIGRGARAGPGHGGQRRRGRHDVGAGRGAGRRRRRAHRLLRRARRVAARPRPLRRGRPQPPRDRPHRPALPGEDRLVMITATPYLAAAADAKLEDWGPLEEALPISGGEPMHTSGTTLWSGDGAQEAGVWECTAGPSRWSLADNEFVHILSGRMTVTPDGGEPAEIGPGDTAVFPRGWAGTWQIHETIRKLYVLF